MRGPGAVELAQREPLLGGGALSEILTAGPCGSWEPDTTSYSRDGSIDWLREEYKGHRKTDLIVRLQFASNYCALDDENASKKSSSVRPLRNKSNNTVLAQGESIDTRVCCLTQTSRTTCRRRRVFCFLLHSCTVVSVLLYASSPAERPMGVH